MISSYRSNPNVLSEILCKRINIPVIDHKATERAELQDLQRKHFPALSTMLATYGVENAVELHLLHRHFMLQEGEAVVHQTIKIPGSPELPGADVDIAKAVTCAEELTDSLIPLLWMASPDQDQDLVPYEYGLRSSITASGTSVSSEVWKSFARAFAAHVH